MNKTTIMLMVGLTIIPLVGFAPEPPEENSVLIPHEKNSHVSQVLDVLTIYNPVEDQCDDSPLITASNAKINVQKLYHQEIRWMALSRDLLKRWKGEFHYGDTVVVASGDLAIDGKWIIQDTMNMRFSNRGDLLFDSRIRSLGRWENVTITKYN